MDDASLYFKVGTHNLVTFWDADVGNWLSSARVADGSGIAPAGEAGRFLASSGDRGVFAIDAWSGSITPMGRGFVQAGSWDNHLVPTPEY